MRWNESIEAIVASLENVIGNMVLCAGAVAYLGPFNAKFRLELMEKWMQKCKNLSIPVDPKFELLNVFVDPVELREWNAQGLPADEFSSVNGLLVHEGSKMAVND